MSLTLPKATAAFILSEGEGSISRETVTLISGQNLAAGTVLGKITTGGKYTAHAAAANNGSQNACAVLYAAVNASAGDKTAVVLTRLAEVADAQLTWESGISAPNKATAVANLATTYVIVRT